MKPDYEVFSCLEYSGEQEPSFDDIQKQFDDQSLRIVTALDRRHRGVKRAWIIMAVCSGLASIYWSIAMWNCNYDQYIMLYNMFLECIFMLLTVKSIIALLAIVRPRTLRTSTIGIVTIFMLVMVSCTTTIGDGMMVSQNFDGRIKAVESVSTMFSKL